MDNKLMYNTPNYRKNNVFIGGKVWALKACTTQLKFNKSA